MPLTCRNDKDPSSYLAAHAVPFHQPISAYARCHLIADGFMCYHPPVGAEIVLFLSEGPLIFYYTIKSICCTHKQLEIKWASLKGLCGCVTVYVCVSVNSPACQWTLKSGGHREPAQLKAAAAWSPSLATCFTPPQAEWWFVVFAHLFTHFICWQTWYLIFCLNPWLCFYFFML